MTINGQTIKDVLVGEVWVGSGQSNMEFVLNNAINKDEEIAHASYPLIHLFHVKRALAEQPADDVAKSSGRADIWSHFATPLDAGPDRFAHGREHGFTRDVLEIGRLR